MPKLSNIYLVKKTYYVTVEGLQTWREEHLEQRKDYEKEYYEDNRKVINEKGLIKVTCDLCGSSVSKIFMLQHKRTIKCKTLNEKKNEII